MNLVKVYEIETGDFMMEYESHIVPHKGEYLFIGKLQVKVLNVYYIIGETNFDGDEYHDLMHIELEVEIVD